MIPWLAAAEVLAAIPLVECAMSSEASSALLSRPLLLWLPFGGVLAVTLALYVEWAVARGAKEIRELESLKYEFAKTK